MWSGTIKRQWVLTRDKDWGWSHRAPGRLHTARLLGQPSLLPSVLPYESICSSRSWLLGTDNLFCTEHRVAPSHCASNLSAPWWSRSYYLHLQKKQNQSVYKCHMNNCRRLETQPACLTWAFFLQNYLCLPAGLAGSPQWEVNEGPCLAGWEHDVMGRSRAEPLSHSVTVPDSHSQPQQPYRKWPVCSFLLLPFRENLI
jgi:hypothetical protein